jgi:hypothetical protein
MKIIALSLQKLNFYENIRSITSQLRVLEGDLFIA